MSAKQLECSWRTLRFVNPFGTAHQLRTHHRVLLARWRGDGFIAYGEASRYYGETPAAMIDALHALAPEIERHCPAPSTGSAWTDLETTWRQLAPKNPSMRALADAIVLDAWSRARRVPAWRLVGQPLSHTIASSFTIGLADEETTLRKAREVASRFRTLKIKLGHPEEEQDVATLEVLRRALPTHQFLLDANASWTSARAERTIHRAAALGGVVMVEQPLKPGQLEAMSELTKRSPLPIYADEDAHDAEMTKRLGEMKAAHGVVLKIMKAGGMAACLRQVDVAEQFGLRLMVGCMVETGVGMSVGALLLPFVTLADLDGNELIADDPMHGGPGMSQADATIRYAGGDGLCVEERVDAKISWVPWRELAPPTDGLPI